MLTPLSLLAESLHLCHYPWRVEPIVDLLKGVRGSQMAREEMGMSQVQDDGFLGVQQHL